MRTPDLDRIFPIHDEASARFAIVKAGCLHSAGVITESEKAIVLARAATVVERRDSRRAA